MDLGRAYALATGLLEEHGLHGWTVVFDTAKRRAGICRFDDRQIGLSGPLTRLHDEAEVRDTVLHEVAHALVGPRHAHDAVWAAQARAIGGTAERCLSAEAPRVEAPWVGVCPAGHTVERHRRPERVLACRTCAPRFDVRHVFEWTHHGRPAQMHPNYTAELRSLESGTRWRLVPVGGRVRVTAPGDLQGRVGRVVGHGRTSYHVELPHGRYRVVFAAAEPA
ncbi:MAG: SprT-like domain-containing protein [Nocardioidaceae bacterium]